MTEGQDTLEECITALVQNLFFSKATIISRCARITVHGIRDQACVRLNFIGNSMVEFNWLSVALCYLVL